MIIRRIPIPTPSAAQLLAAAHAAPGDVVWLDSAVGHRERGRRSLLAWELEARVSVDAGDDAPAWATLDERWRAEAAAHGACADLGWVGAIAYEAAPLADAGMPSAATGAPQLRLAAVRAGVALGPDGAHLVAAGETAEAADARVEAVRAALDAPAPPPAGSLQCLDDLGALQAWHREAVTDVLARIDEGRVYQACLTFPLRLAGPDASLLPAYAALRAASPGDFAAYVRLGGLEAASSSPERFVAIDGRRIESRPMKGTSPRSRDVQRDIQAAMALRTSEKDRAENVMIVDLVRNDLGRVCEVGSVHVPELFLVESYDTVHQMTSTVRGTLRDGVGPFEAMAAAFPPGSMTGAPKIAACHELARLERAPRGLYAGTIVRLGYDGRCAASVVIRTLQRDAAGLRYDVGGGIVADSTPEAEWAEALTKAEALVRAGLLPPFG